MNKTLITLALAATVSLTSMAAAVAAGPDYISPEGIQWKQWTPTPAPSDEHNFITDEGVDTFIKMQQDDELNRQFNTVEYKVDESLQTYYLVLDQNKQSRRLMLQVLPLLRQGMTNLVIIPIGILGQENPKGLAADFLANAGSFEYLQAWAEGAIPDASKATPEALAKIEKNNTTAVRALHLADAPVSLKYDPNEKGLGFSFIAGHLRYTPSFNYFELAKWPNKAWTSAQLTALNLAPSKEVVKKFSTKLLPYQESDLTEQVCTKQGQCWNALPKDVASAQPEAPSGGQKALKVLLDIFRP